MHRYIYTHKIYIPVCSESFERRPIEAILYLKCVDVTVNIVL